MTLALDLHALEQFLYREAMLLDEKRWADWLALYTEDCFYWIPSVVGQKDPVNTISHVVGNVMLDPESGQGADGGMNPEADLVLRSTAHIVEYRKEEQRLFGGTVRHWLRRSGSDFKIAMKRIDLINCDAPMEVVQLFL